jgi:hypothetical protein
MGQILIVYFFKTIYYIMESCKYFTYLPALFQPN